MGRRALIRALVPAVLAVGLVPVAGVGPAVACSCSIRTDGEARRTADLVFVGAVAARDEYPPPGPFRSSSDPVIYRFEVSRVFKGDAVASQGVRSIVGGEACGLELRGPGPFLVFASDPRRPVPATVPAEDRSLPEAYLCGGTRSTADTPVPFRGGRMPRADPAPVAAAPTVPTAPVVAAPAAEDDGGVPAGWIGLGLGAALVAATGLFLVRRRV